MGWRPPSTSMRVETIDSGEQLDQEIFARLRTAGGQAQRGGFGGDLGRKGRVIDVDADAGDGDGIGDELHQNAGSFALAEHDVVGPAQVGLQIGNAGDGFGGG